jgi:hypothetical protein
MAKTKASFAEFSKRASKIWDNADDADGKVRDLCALVRELLVGPATFESLAAADAAVARRPTKYAAEPSREGDAVESTDHEPQPARQHKISKGGLRETATAAMRTTGRPSTSTDDVVESAGCGSRTRKATLYAITKQELLAARRRA